MDDFDRRILDLLQRDADRSLNEIAAEVGLSPTPCWKRIKRLEEEGVIRGRVALLDPARVGAGVTVFVSIRTAEHDAAWLQAFAEAVAAMDEVVDFYRMGGDVDYLLRVVVPDIAAYDAFYKKLVSRVKLADVTSRFAMDTIKSTTVLPLDALPVSGRRGARA